MSVYPLDHHQQGGSHTTDKHFPDTCEAKGDQQQQRPRKSGNHYQMALMMPRGDGETCQSQVGQVFLQ
ncbi:hypothetical protein [Microbulbifer sp. 2205BS26-8]|uniref:hypothetical protein n=1 Tax=Microbulbifer sp. 2205BS26-8 TaxID=3064386 RepID=UPI00273DD8D7|nr:hypothetical protein [Microbulbifer sp. 2205BS26-8]MDP5209619.1 hypothetical protein [Microbulbifer sp. 2205BS26-8]